MDGYWDRVMHLFPVPGVSMTALEATGTRIITQEWGELVDFESGCWAAVLGHSCKEVVEEIKTNAGHLFHPGPKLKILKDSHSIRQRL